MGWKKQLRKILGQAKHVADLQRHYTHPYIDGVVKKPQSAAKKGAWPLRSNKTVVKSASRYDLREKASTHLLPRARNAFVAKLAGSVTVLQREMESALKRG